MHRAKANRGKGSDPFSQRTTRNERFAQMSKQEQLIEQKKKELMAKMAAQTAAKAGPVLPSTGGASSTAPASTAPKPPQIRPGGLGKRPNWWKSKATPATQSSAANEPIETPVAPSSIKIQHQHYTTIPEVAIKTEFKRERSPITSNYSSNNSYSYDRGHEPRAPSPYSPSRMSPEPSSPPNAAVPLPPPVPPAVYAAPPPSMLVPPFPPPALTSAPPPMMQFSGPPPPVPLMSVPPPNLSAPPPPMAYVPPPPPQMMQQQPPPPPLQQPYMDEVAKVSPAGAVEVLSAASRQLAEMVAEGGDEIEEMAREKNRDDPAMWFLYQPDSEAYKRYSDLVRNLRALKNAKKEFAAKAERNRKRKTRWAPQDDNKLTLPPSNLPRPNIPPNSAPAMLSQIGRTDPKLLAYARTAYGTIDLSEEDWKKCEDHYKVHLLYNEMMRKKEQLARLAARGKHRYEYDSDEETDGGTWEHKLRSQEMEATDRWAAELTKQAEGKHHIGDFLPPTELKKFMEEYSAAKEGRPLDISDYKEFKLKEDNIGFKMLQKLGWSEGQGLGSEGQGIVDPVNKGNSRSENHGLGVTRPDNLTSDDDEYDAYRKRMMLAYRFRPNPLNNPRRSYY